MPKELLKLLRDSEAVYRIVVESASDAILSLDAHNTIIFANRAAERIFGYPVEELTGRTVDILMPDGFAARLRRDLSRYLETGERRLSWENMKVPARRRDGSDLTVEISLAECRENDERIFVVVARDVSERLRAEQSLSESQAMLALALRSSNIGVWEQDLTTDTVNWSPELEEIFGLRKGDFRRTTDSFYEHLHEDDRARIKSEVQNAIAEKREYEIEFRFRRPDGSVRWMEGRGRAFYAETGEPVRLYGTGVDITERKKADEILRQSSRDIIKMADAMPQVVWIAGADGVVNYYNRRVSAFYGGLGKLGSGVWNWQPFVHEDDLDATIAAWDEAVRAQTPYAVEHRIRMNDETFRWHLSRAFPVKTESGEIERWFGTATDIDDLKRAGEALLASEERYRSIVNQTVAGIAEVDLSGKFLTVNDRFCEIAGYARAEFLSGMRMQDITHPSDLPRNLELLQRLTETGEAFDIEKRYVRRDGSLIWMHNHVSAIRDAAGRPQSIVAVVNDVTERRQVEEALRESEKRFRNMADNAPVMVWVTDAAGYCNYLSQSWYDFTGQTPAEGLGLGWVDAVHPDDRRHAEESFIRDNARRAPFNVEYRFRRKDGVYRWAIDSAQPRFSETGEYLGYVGSVVDIDDRKRGEEQIKYQLDLTETITDNTQSCLLMMDENGRGTFANHATERITGFQPDELIGEILHEKIHHTRPDGTPFPLDECPLDNALPIEEAVVGYEDVFVHKNGHFYPVRCAARPIFKNEKPIGTVVEIQDITEEKRIEAERAEILVREQTARRAAEDANRAKDEFLSVLSHELRTPLNAILGWTRMLKSGSLDEARNRQAIETIERNARLQNNLIEDLLDVSRIISGKIRIETEKLDLAHVAASAVETVRPLAEAKNITIETRAESETLEICGDATRLQQIIVNLVNNAVKFTPAGGAVVVRLSRTGEKARLEVADTGIGIGAEFLPHIFDRFRQADSTTQRNHSGLGLGLTIVRHLVGLHDGEIFARSDGEGKGATFVVEIPLPGAANGKFDSCAPAVVAADAVGDDQVLRSKSILLVDDDCDGMQPLKLFLEMHGAEAHCADSAAAGLREFERRGFDMILSDIGMPDTDGYAFIGQVRQLPANANVPAIALTAYASADDRERAIAAGFDTHLAKPLDFEKLLQTIVEVFERNNKTARATNET